MNWSCYDPLSRLGTLGRAFRPKTELKHFYHPLLSTYFNSNGIVNKKTVCRQYHSTISPSTPTHFIGRRSFKAFCSHY